MQERRGALAVDADGVSHGDFDVGAPEVVLADVEVRNSGAGQRVGEALPGGKSDLEVLAHVQRPDAPIAQHPRQMLQLGVQHALQRPHDAPSIRPPLLSSLSLAATFRHKQGP